MSRQMLSWNPLQELDRVQREVTRRFPEFCGTNGRRSQRQNPIDAWQDENSLLLTVDVPGIDPEKLEITVTEDKVTLKGERPVRELGDNQQWLLQEAQAGEFERTLKLPFEVDPEQTEATCEHGVLSLTLQRPQQQRPHKVTVKAV